MEKIIKPFCALLGTSLVVVFYQLLSFFIINQTLLQIISVIASTAVVVISEFIFLEVPKKVFFLRKHILPLGKFEGIWLQSLDRTKKYAICKVEYQEDSTYSFYGTNFSSDHASDVSFHSHNIIYEKEMVGFSYLVEGQHFSGEFMKCWGYISFNKHIFTKRYDDGKGFFIDIGTELSGCNFHVERIDPQYLKNNRLTFVSFKNVNIDDFIADYFSWRNAKL